MNNLPPIPKIMETIEETMLQTAVKSVAASLDAVIRKAISNHLGHDVWTLEEVTPRLSRCASPGSVLETITMDGEPILTIGPTELAVEERDMSTFFCVLQGYKILNEKIKEVAR